MTGERILDCGRSEGQTVAAGVELGWQADGLCRQVDPDLWFPDLGERANDAKRICADCPVTDLCLDWALAHDERFGVWGGLSAAERAPLTPSPIRRSS